MYLVLPTVVICRIYKKMAAIVGVVVGFLGPAFEVGKCIYEPIKRQFDYLCCFNNNVRNLRDEARKLEDTKKDLQRRVDEEENNARVVFRAVETWLEDAIVTQAEIVKTEDEITTTKSSCFALKPRYSLSRKVKKTAEAIKELRESCHFKIISHPSPPAALVPTPQGPYSKFESRKDIEEGVIRSLRDHDKYVVGICGMGGVGKTTMAKNIMHRLREEDLFQEIVMVVASQNADPLKMQTSIAESLGMKLECESLPARAHLLRTRLSNLAKRSLIVVDDVWDNLKLEELGIACFSWCKVLLTSRNADVLKRMKVEKVHVVKILTKEEAWHLFTSCASNCIRHQNLMSVARQVAAECKGLPIALVTVGATLNDVENEGVWKDWMHQLKGDNPIGLPEFLDDVYKPLRLSYEFLKNKEAESLFLLCCLYPEDYQIPLEELTIYAMGLHLLKGIKSLEEARNRVCSLVEILKSRFLLLEGRNKNHVKMHDVVRDVGIFIASDEKLITCDSKTNGCTWISPHIGERIGFQAGSTVFPNLHLLWIDHDSRDKELEIDNQFFQGMKELNVFSVKCSSLQQLPQTTRILVSLQALVLEFCGSLKSISIVGELVNLEILICRSCKSIESLPMEIGKLRRLRLLELSNCYNLKTIAPGIISSLNGLEELIVQHSFDGWEAENSDKERKNASLIELEKLSSLSRLKIDIKDYRLASQQLLLSPKIVKYHIRIGNVPVYLEQSRLHEKTVSLALPGNINLGNWIDKCVGRAEKMYLEGDGSSMVFEAAQNIRNLVFTRCSMVKKLVTTANTFPLLEILELNQLSELKEICDIGGPMGFNSLINLKILRLKNLPALEHLNIVSHLNKLSSLYVYKCDRLRTLSSSLPLLLGRLEIRSCRMMEEVFRWNHDSQKVFPNLKSVVLKDLPKLTNFIKGQSIEFPLLEEVQVSRCPLKNFVFTTSISSSGEAIQMISCGVDNVGSAPAAPELQ